MALGFGPSRGLSSPLKYEEHVAVRRGTLSALAWTWDFVVGENCALTGPVSAWKMVTEYKKMDNCFMTVSDSRCRTFCGKHGQLVALAPALLIRDSRVVNLVRWVPKRSLTLSPVASLPYCYRFRLLGKEPSRLN
jgi:hypothetical protein